MSPDVDELLHEAGARWRAEQPPPAEPVVSPRPAPWRRHATVLAAVAAVLVIVAGALVGSRMLSHKRADKPAPADAHTPVPSADPTGLVVHDGDTAEATGLVIAVIGRSVIFCPEMPIMDPRSTDRLGTCGTPFSITVTGVDLTRLSDREQLAQGTVKGRAVLRGVYSGGVLRVTRQTPVPPRTTDPNAGLPSILRSPPCPAPSGGWHGQADTEAIGAYTRMRPGSFNGMGVTYPFPPHFTVTVAVVGVARGNPDTVQSDLRARFGPNICAVHVDFTALEQKRVQEAVDQLGQRNGIYGSGGAGNFRPVTVEISLVTPERFDKLREIGLAKLEIHPWLKPVR
jgi:hypothetical protein